MKKIFLLFFTISTLSFVNAQDITYGIKAGLNYADLNLSDTSDETEDLKPRTAFHIGAIADISLTDTFSIQPELLYSSKGAKFELTEGDATMKLQIIENYLSIPVMFKYFATEDLSIELGPEVGILMSAKTKIDISGTGTDADSTEEEDFKDEMKSTEVGLGFGLGYKMEMGLFFNARYTVGMTNIAEDINDDEYIKNNVFQFSVGYRFN